MTQVSSTATIDPVDLTRLRALLEQERSTLAAALGHATDDSDGDASPDTSELDALRYQQGMSAAVATLTRAALADVEAALARVEDGTYGACLDCSAPIPVERLEAMPAAGYCVSCQQSRE